MNLRNKILLGISALLLVVGIPAVVFLSQQRQETRSRASASTTLYLVPSTTSAAPLQKNPGQPVLFDVMVNPGSNRPSLVKLELAYDGNKLTPTSSPFTVNTTAFPETREGPLVRNNTILIAVSVGNDPSKAISTVTKVGTVNFTATSTTTTPTVVSFGSASQVVSVASTDQATENVLSTTTPAYVSISNPITPSPTPTPPPGNTTLTCSPTSKVLTDLMSPVSVTLKNAAGTGIAGKTVSWTSSSPMSITPPSSLTNASGVASTSVGVTNLGTGSFTGTLTARFTGDTTDATATCVIQVSYTAPTPTPTATPIPSPTPTTAPTSTKLSISVFIHGIGNSGDNANPNSFSMSNKNPLTPTRTVEVEIINSANTVVATSTGTVVYNSTAGNFQGTIDTGLQIPSTGSYNVKVKAKTQLRRILPGIQTITIGQINTLPAVTLIAGDINSDNALNILDYNILIGCYSDLDVAKSCTTTNKPLADLNDNGQVNQFDYNLFLRELSVQAGQ